MEIQRIGMMEARNKLTELVETAQIKGQRYIFEHHQRPAAVLLGYEDFENLMEIIAEQTDQEFQESLRQSMAEAKAGKGYTKSEVLAMAQEWEKQERGSNPLRGHTHQF